MHTANSIPTMPLAAPAIAPPPGRCFDPSAIYSQQDLAAMLEVSERLIHKMRRARRGRLPQPFFMGRKPFWRGQTMIEWFARRQQEAA